MKQSRMKQLPETARALTSALLVAALEKRVAVGERRFDLLFRAYPTPTYVWQRQEQDFVLVDFNDAAITFTQGAIRNFIGQQLQVLYADEREILEDFERCLRDRTIISRELPGYRLRSTGEVKDIVASLVPVEPDLVLAIISDVTTERRALTEWRKLSSAVEQTADAVFITDRNAVIEYVNPAFEQITGFSREEALGKTPRILKSGKMTTEYYFQLWKSVLAGKPFRTQTVNRRRDGELFVVEQTITPMKNDAGRITHFVSVLKDMTERIQLQEGEAEQRLAGIVQKQLFPLQPPSVAGYDMAGAVFPARATSGDYFDYIAMPGGTLGLVVADVCDHGMGSALIMAEVRAYLRSIIRYETDLQRLLGELNHLISPDLSNSNFITMFMARLDPQLHCLEYANAGNWPGYVLNGQGRVVKEMQTDGFPIGLFPDLKLRRSSPVPLEPGHMLLLMTDGIPEAVNRAGKAFGMRRVLNVVRRHRAEPAAEIIGHIRQAVVAFMGTTRQDDDQTIIICKRLS